MTIVVDTSALMSVLLGEADAEAQATRLADHVGELVISTASLVEVGIVARAKRGAEGVRDLDRLLSALGMEEIPVSGDHARAAIEAWTRFGKGRHPAALNYGDCFSYALATCLGAPLLFKGRDFSQTDIAQP